MIKNRTENLNGKACPPRRWQVLKQQLKNLPPQDFARALKNGKEGLLLDVRTAEEFQQAHLPGAINISYLMPDLWDRLEKLDPQASYYVYCRTERRSLRVCMLMQNGGFSNVYNMDGGLCAWEGVFGPVAQRCV